MKSVPTTWDEVRFIDGYPGRFCIMARRSGDKWYIAGINAGQQPVKKTIQLPLLAKGSTVAVYTDDAQLQGSLKTQRLNGSRRLSVTIPENGAAVIVGDTAE